MRGSWLGVALVLGLAPTRAYAESEPGAPELAPTPASLDVLIPVITRVGTFVTPRREMMVRGMRPVIPIVTAHGTVVEWHRDDRVGARKSAAGGGRAEAGAMNFAGADGGARAGAMNFAGADGGARADATNSAGGGSGARADAMNSAESRGGARADAMKSAAGDRGGRLGATDSATGDRGARADAMKSAAGDRAARAGAMNSAENSGGARANATNSAAASPPPSPRDRSAFSLALHYEAGYIGPADLNEALTAEAGGVRRVFALFGGLGLGLEVRPHPWVGLSATGSYLLAPPETIDDSLHYLHAVAGTAAARLYIPTVDSLDIAMGFEGSIHWAGYREHTAVGPGFVWRFGVQLLDADLPSVLATIYVRRARLADDDGFELDLSGIGAMADFAFDL